MSQFKKALARLKVRPKDFTYEEIESFLQNPQVGFKIRGGGKHRNFVRGSITLTIKANSCLKEYNFDQIEEVLRDIGVWEE